MPIAVSIPPRPADPAPVRARMSSPGIPVLARGAEQEAMPESQDRGSPPPFDHRLVRALDHPVRATFLRLLAERDTLSPAQATALIDDAAIPLANVVYHARVLHGLGLIEAAGEPDPRMGVPFRVTSTGAEALVALGISPS